MALRQIITHPNEKLSRPSEPVTEIDDEIRTLLRDMAETMYAAPGVGLAAPQVAVNLRAIVIDTGPSEHGGSGLIQLVNPEILEADGVITWEEGCLSVPGVTEDVDRSGRVMVKGLDPNGEEKRFEAEGLLAVAFQHEIDHLDGTLFFERLSPLKRRLLLKEYKRLQEEAKDKQDKIL